MHGIVLNLLGDLAPHHLLERREELLTIGFAKASGLTEPLRDRFDRGQTIGAGLTANLKSRRAFWA